MDRHQAQKEGTHPVNYVATGSHANYFGSALYLGRGARGLRLRRNPRSDPRLQLQTVLLPDIVPSPRPHPFAWLERSRAAGARRRAASTTAPGPALNPVVGADPVGSRTA